MGRQSIAIEIDDRLRGAIEDEARIERRSTSYVLRSAAEEYLSRRTFLREKVARLETEADKGAFVSEDAMTRWFESLGTENELPPPVPDTFFDPDE